jgi:glycosyltransferase involved in cell wall biosynthesis
VCERGPWCAKVAEWPVNVNYEMADFTLAFITNVWNHYQASLCREVVRLIGPSRFRMILCEEMPQERLKLGWAAFPPEEEWVLGPPSGSTLPQALVDSSLRATAAIIGSAPRELVSRRVRTGQLTLLMAERLWKKPWRWSRILRPRTALGIQRFRALANRNNVHYLAIGSGAADDAKQIGAFDDRVWTWSYFADVSPNPPSARSGDRVNILWVGRMLQWKRVDVLLRAVATIAAEPTFERLQVVGSGDQEPFLRGLAERLGLGNKCVFHPSTNPDAIRALMRGSDIYVLASDRNEGWGVVANEAISEGCVLVANREAGASTILIEDGRTGFLFGDGDAQQLAEILRILLGDRDLREAVRTAAYNELARLWHPRVGAERLLSLIDGLLGHGPLPDYPEGPCSRSERTK